MREKNATRLNRPAAMAMAAAAATLRKSSCMLYLTDCDFPLRSNIRSAIKLKTNYLTFHIIFCCDSCCLLEHIGAQCAHE